MVSGVDVLAALRVVSLREVSVAGVTLKVRGLTAAERVLLRARAQAGDPLQAHEIVGLAACNDAGGPLFTPELAAELGQVDGASIEAICEAILEASGLLANAEEQAAKN